MARIKRTTGERLARFRRALRPKETQAALVTDPVSVRYLSAFTGDDSWLLVRGRGATLITDGRFTEQAQRECRGLSVVVRRGPMLSALGREVRRRRIERLAFDPEHVTVSQRSRLGRALKGVKLVRAAGVVSELRLRKDPSEVRAIRRAVRAAEEAWTAFREVIRPGMTERRLAAELDGHLRVAGSEATPFPTICAVDASSAMPHARPGKRRLKTGSVLLVDFGARVDGYVCDLTRCVFVARIRPRVREVYEAVLSAQWAAIAAAGPGASSREVDAAARGVLEDAGWAEQFEHGTGHGVGLEVHEGPSLSPHAGATELESGMVVTVEPGVYLRGRFGIRIEDDVLVTERGRRVLTSLEKDLQAMVV